MKGHCSGTVRGSGKVEDAVADDLGRLHQFLQVYQHRLPDVQCASADKCSLFPVDRAYVFSHSDVNNFIANLFGSIHQATGRFQHAPQVKLNRFDLFHAHLFLTQKQTLGLLFHAQEFPQLSEQFPFNLGYCQSSSDLVFTKAGMDWRNFLWHKGALAALDLSEESELLGCLVPDWLRPLRTTYEGDFGTPLGDFYFFPSKLLEDSPPSQPEASGLVLFFPRASPP